MSPLRYFQVRWDIAQLPSEDWVTGGTVLVWGRQRGACHYRYSGLFSYKTKNGTLHATAQVLRQHVLDEVSSTGWCKGWGGEDMGGLWLSCPEELGWLPGSCRKSESGTVGGSATKVAIQGSHSSTWGDIPEVGIYTDFKVGTWS